MMLKPPQLQPSRQITFSARAPRRRAPGPPPPAAVRGSRPRKQQEQQEQEWVPAEEAGSSSSDDPAAAALAAPLAAATPAAPPAAAPRRARRRRFDAVEGPPPTLTARPLPRVLLLHTGGTLGMDPGESYERRPDGAAVLRAGTGGSYVKALRPGSILANITSQVPELRALADLDVRVVCNKDSSNVGPREWVALARALHSAREHYDAFLIVHGTDTMAYTAAALSLCLAGFRKPVVLTGSQVPLALPRSDARQNLIDSLTVATAAFNPPHVAFAEVAVCFGGRLLRGNRAQKTSTDLYQAFDSPGHPPLAELGVGVQWNRGALLAPEGVYRPRFELEPRVLRVPIVPGCDPRAAYGDLAGRGVRGVVLEVFGVGNLPDAAAAGWLPWLRDQRRKGLAVYLRSQSAVGSIHPELYRSGAAALRLGVEAGPQMTPECAVVKMMLCLKHPDLPLGMPLSGEI